MADWQARSRFRRKRVALVLAVVGVVLFVIYLAVVGNRGS